MAEGTRVVEEWTLQKYTVGRGIQWGHATSHYRAFSHSAYVWKHRSQALLEGLTVLVPGRLELGQWTMGTLGGTAAAGAAVWKQHEPSQMPRCIRFLGSLRATLHFLLQQIWGFKFKDRVNSLRRGVMRSNFGATLRGRKV